MWKRDCDTATEMRDPKISGIELLKSVSCASVRLFTRQCQLQTCLPPHPGDISLQLQTNYLHSKASFLVQLLLSHMLLKILQFQRTTVDNLGVLGLLRKFVVEVDLVNQTPTMKSLLYFLGGLRVGISQTQQGWSVVASLYHSMSRLLSLDMLSVAGQRTK